MCPLGVPHIYGTTIDALEATCASCIMLYELQPDSTATIFGCVIVVVEYGSVDSNLLLLIKLSFVIKVS